MIRPSLDPADALFVGGCVGAYVQRCCFKARVGGCLTDYQSEGVTPSAAMWIVLLLGASSYCSHRESWEINQCFPLSLLGFSL
ncbi:unnamed protein product [Boreogadus saida]